MCKHDVMHKTGSIQRIAKPQKEDRAAAVGNMHEKLVKIGHAFPEIAGGETYRRTHRQTHAHTQTNKHTDHNTPPTGVTIS